jgi:transcriptional regulator NrdR family protein
MVPKMTNPLSQYFRQPSIYIKLPSGGQHYPPGTIDMPANEELPIFPMTAIDEITYRTPDALYNGSATVNVIQSCVPNIKDAWSIPAMDLDTILIAIRIASYGHDMDFATKCPNCGHDHEVTADLRSVLEQIRRPNYANNIADGDLEIYFRPMSYKNLNDNNRVQFEQQKILQSVSESSLTEEEKLNTLSRALKQVTDLTVQSLAQSISTIKTPTALVTEPEYIADFLKNCDRVLFNRIRDYIVDLKAEAEIQPLKLRCPECKHEYTQLVTMDMASFFGSAS